MTGSPQREGRPCNEERRAKRLVIGRPQGVFRAQFFLAMVLLVLVFEGRTYWATLGQQLQLRRALTGSLVNETAFAAATAAAAAAAAAANVSDAAVAGAEANNATRPAAAVPQQLQKRVAGFNASALAPFMYSAIGLRLQEQIAEGKRVEWLHLPKTGTSFGNTLIPWVCPRLPDDWQMRKMGLPKSGTPDVCMEKFKYENSSVIMWRLGDHVGLENRTDDELSRVFTMVRSPRERLVSGFHHVHRYKRLNATDAEICAFVRNTVVSHASAGTQVRMIIGDHVETGTVPGVGMWRLFDSVRMPTLEEAELACQRLKRFAFVGLTRYWDASVCLFHSIYGGRVRPNEHKNMRPGVHHVVDEAAKQADCGDRPDDRLYQCAVEWFLERLRDYPTCAQELNATAIAQEAQEWVEGGAWVEDGVGASR